MAKKEKTPVFTTEFALKTDSHQTRKLNLKFEAMTSLYNQLLKFLLKQHEKLKKDRDYLNTVEKYRMNKKALIESQNTIFLLEKSANKKTKDDEKKKGNRIKFIARRKKFFRIERRKNNVAKTVFRPKPNLST